MYFWWSFKHRCRIILFCHLIVLSKNSSFNFFFNGKTEFSSVSILKGVTLSLMRIFCWFMSRIADFWTFLYTYLMKFLDYQAVFSLSSAGTARQHWWENYANQPSEFVNKLQGKQNSDVTISLVANGLLWGDLCLHRMEINRPISTATLFCLMKFTKIDK